MKIHLLSGFLGSGKTTAIQHAARLLLQQGIRTGVITNDQGSRLVDGDYFKSLDIPGRQVMNGCFCCNYNDLDAGIQSLIETNDTEVIFAESVGSCTDIIATVLKPLVKFRPGARVTVSIFTDVRLLQMILEGDTNSFDETVNYIYLKQLEEAGVVVVNKIDLVGGDQLAKVKELMAEKYGDKLLLYQNSLDEKSVTAWLGALDQFESFASLPSLDIDYDIYAVGEAKLAWLDEEIELFSADNQAMEDAVSLIKNIYDRITSHNYAIGHLKFLINDDIKISFTSAAQPAAEVATKPASSVKLLMNIRVQTGPDEISGVVTDAIKEIEMQTDCKIILNSRSAFQPGYPRPTHRI